MVMAATQQPVPVTQLSPTTPICTSSAVETTTTKDSTIYGDSISKLKDGNFSANIKPSMEVNTQLDVKDTPLFSITGI